MRELFVSIGEDWLFDERYPVWRCPGCGELNRYINSFFELCGRCGRDHTSDWDQYVVSGKINEDV